MRRRLILVFLAISTMVGSAFVVPLAVLVRRTAEDRAIDAAWADVARRIAHEGRAVGLVRADLVAIAQLDARLHTNGFAHDSLSVFVIV